MKKILLTAVLVLVTWVGTSDVHAWGPIGHQIVAQIAELRLSDKAKAAIKKILGDEAFTNEVLDSWADNIRIERKETGPWHYVDIPFDAKEYNPDRDSKEGKPGEGRHDIVERIAFFTSVLKDADARPEAKYEALKFIIHFLGDLHQPLHCAERNGDKGGNKLQVQLLKDEKPINMHRAWDIDLVKFTIEENAPLKYAAALNEKISAEDAANWAKGEVKDWAMESHAVAVDKVYGGVPVDGVFQMDKAYIEKCKPAIDQQFQRGGVRLAAILNKIFE